jgi:polysaccharide export outer membrane protein
VRHTRAGAGIRGLIRARAKALAIVAGLPLLSGCAETDSFLLDPSVLGRWEHTPTTVPILTRLATVEGPADEFVEATDVQPTDLIPEVTEYRIGPGDLVRVEMFDIPDVDRATPFERIVDTRGFVDLPQIGRVNLSGLSVDDAQRAIMQAMRDLTANPLATVVVLQPRQQQITVFGAVQLPGRYTVPAADYRLLDALAAAGGWSEAPQDVYVIRQLPLSPESGAARVQPSAGPQQGQPPAPGGENLLDIINQYAPPAPPPSTPPKPEEHPQEGNPPHDLPPGGNPGMMQPGTPAQPEPAAAPIDLPGRPGQPAPRPIAQPFEQPAGDSTWVFLEGRWVRVKRSGVPGPAGSDVVPGTGVPIQQLVTQRVIRVSSRALASGDARYNIIIRPGDVIRVPPPPSGNVYLAGQVARPGVFGLAENLTLQRIVAAAGGLNQIAVPERVDVIRMVGRDRQAIVRVNLRAIFEGTQPDIYLKNNDMVNVGTNFWATPLAVIRNGFRMTYGFGFLVDRNFGNDIFGAPPGERFR